MLAFVFAHPRSRLRRRMQLVACALVSLSLVLLSCAPLAMSAGLGGSNSFNELTKTEPEAARTQTVSGQSNAETSGSSNSKSLLLVGGVVAVALLGGIAFVIMRDAGRFAPAGDAQLTEARSRRDAAARVRRRRAQAKAARHHRKRNR
jgi:predicted PurR-regulated permease PerM